MALASAQLTSAITATQLQFALSNISSSTMLPTVGAQPLSVGVPMQLDGEITFIVSQPVAGTVVVRGRGSDGTAAAAHDTLCNVFFSSSPADFPAPAAGTMITLDLSQDTPVSIGQDATITAPGNSNTVYNINKATAAAITLVAPSLSAQGTEMVFTSQTAAAHVITATSLLADGVAGSPHTTATFAALKGASMTLVAENGLWNVKALVAVTIT